MKYELEVTYKGFDMALDAAIEKAAGVNRVSSGYGFGDMRDMQLVFETKLEALDARERIVGLNETIEVSAVYESDYGSI